MPHRSLPGAGDACGHELLDSSPGLGAQQSSSHQVWHHFLLYGNIFARYLYARRKEEGELREDLEGSFPHFIPSLPDECVMGHNQLVPGQLKNMEYAICTTKQSWHRLNVGPMRCGFVNTYVKYRTWSQWKRRKIACFKEMQLGNGFAVSHTQNLCGLTYTVKQYLVLGRAFSISLKVSTRSTSFHQLEHVTALSFRPWRSCLCPKCISQWFKRGFQQSFMLNVKFVPMSPVQMLKS